MPAISRSRLFNKLNKSTYQAFESATSLCKLRGNSHIDWVHVLAQLTQKAGTDVACIVTIGGVDLARLISDITKALESLPRSADPVTDFSSSLLQSLESAWIFASVEFGADSIRSGHLLLAALSDTTIRKQLLEISPQLNQIDPERLHAEFADSVKGSSEGQSQPAEHSVHADAQSALTGRAIEKYTVDMTAQAKAGQFDAIAGRDSEISQLIDVLMRRRQNNPVLTGEAGVGKTAVAEGLAQRIASGAVPDGLKGVRLLSLDLGLLQAGASMKGEFEQRLRDVVEQVQGSLTPIILFIDELHTLVGAGGQAGTGDAANLLKPALARGTLRTVGATTYDEYKKHIEKDPALGRRFQVVKVEEPALPEAVNMLRSVVPSLEAHHGVLIRQSAVVAAVKLSARYLPARHLPDKAVSLLDTACARVALSQQSVPSVIEEIRASQVELKTTIQALERETSLGEGVEDELQSKQHQLHESEIELARLEDIWKQSQHGLLALQSLTTTDVSASKVQYSEKRQQWLETQGELRLIHADVDEKVVADVLSDWTGIPLNSMVEDELNLILNLPTFLGERIIGQDHALDIISRRIQTSRAALDNPDKPVGVFLLAGTSGVGKTETALALADVLYGGQNNLVTINMSEYQEPHSVAGLKGSPPGYVGYGEGGVLTEAVRKRPYSVVLLDEVEKAHPDVHELFFQVFDKGWMEDGEGRQIDFRNTLILLTTNVGTNTLMRQCEHGAIRPCPDALVQALYPELQAVFSPALMGRMVTIPYYPLGREMILRIVNLQLSRVIKRMQDEHNIHLQIAPEVYEQIANRCQQVESGGRLVESIITNTLLPSLSRMLLEAMLAGQNVTAIDVCVTEGDFGYLLHQ